MGDCQTKEQAGSMQDIRPLCVSQCVPHIDQPQFMNMGVFPPKVLHPHQGRSVLFQCEFPEFGSELLLGVSPCCQCFRILACVAARSRRGWKPKRRNHSPHLRSSQRFVEEIHFPGDLFALFLCAPRLVKTAAFWKALPAWEGSTLLTVVLGRKKPGGDFFPWFQRSAA